MLGCLAGRQRRPTQRRHQQDGGVHQLGRGPAGEQDDRANLSPVRLTDDKIPICRCPLVRLPFHGVRRYSAADQH